jgi:hypothetical protein
VITSKREEVEARARQALRQLINEGVVTSVSAHLEGGAWRVHVGTAVQTDRRASEYDAVRAEDAKVRISGALEGLPIGAIRTAAMGM